MIVSFQLKSLQQLPHLESLIGKINQIDPTSQNADIARMLFIDTPDDTKILDVLNSTEGVENISCGNKTPFDAFLVERNGQKGVVHSSKIQQGDKVICPAEKRGLR